jgi:hypothetical protein
MTMIKAPQANESKWVQQIVELQHEDGSWGHFHTLSQPTKEQPMTTEQALRRLRILGLTKDDEPIARAIKYMETNLLNPNPTVFIEKKHDSKTYGDLMLATWIRLFDRNNKTVLTIARKWASVITCAFQNGTYSHVNYVAAYESEFTKLNPKAGCLVDFCVFYQIVLLPRLLSTKIESLMLDYVLSHPSGIYYIYENALNTLPEQFASRKASRYLAAVELLSEYALASEKLGFVADWLKGQQDQNGQWDMGSVVKDGIYFPLSDSWRKVDDRKRDCTVRIEKLLSKIGGKEDV